MVRLMVAALVVGLGGCKEAAKPDAPKAESAGFKQLKDSLAKAQSGGAKSLRAWLDAYGKSVQDPRLASVQLDYVLLIGRENPAEARRIFADVKKRTPSNSPVYPRVKQLEGTYGP